MIHEVAPLTRFVKAKSARSPTAHLRASSGAPLSAIAISTKTKEDERRIQKRMRGG
jgi:hypothetical protein